MSESLTVDQAVELMEAPPVADASAPESQVEQAEDTQVSPDTTGEGVGEAEQPGDDAIEAEEVSTDEQTEEVEAEPVPPPQWWDAEAKAHFAELTPEDQKIVLEQENKREAITAKVKQDAAEAKKAADALVQSVQPLAERMQEALTADLTAFAERWNGATPEFWAALAAQDPMQHVQLKSQFEAELSTLQAREQMRNEAQQTLKAAETRAQKEHLDQLALTLQEKAPELAANNFEAVSALHSYGLSNGIAPEVFSSATAEELVILNKARLWDEAQAGAKAKAAQTQAAPKTPPAKVVTPVASSSPINAQQRDLQTLQNRFHQTKTLDDAVKLYEAQERLGLI